MTIEILPAQLANQIAAGEVVERPASVIKELVENSLDAGATTIKITIEKGGAKRIRISDNGSGIAKEQLTLALSRHATSKIKNIHDLEGINSLGFRGEALASISSVSRLTLTSKPANQAEAWQAKAEGRDMQVDIQPAAHPDGTTIDVKDLFFNTPARRKFLRTEKTEFSHIEEVVKRIALARLDVTFTLIHNEKTIRQYRAAHNKNQYLKRIAQICGQKFVDHAVEVDCQHDDLHFSGWLATPDFSRSQNDLCYSYVNGRMMRDKLINHAIRQAYADLLPSDSYPAFVLFLTLDVREVDVNVHPAKHEVRFHQGRYVHDFIFSVCQQALAEQQIVASKLSHGNNTEHDEQGQAFQQNYSTQQSSEQTHNNSHVMAAQDTSYIAPLRTTEPQQRYQGSGGQYSHESSSARTHVSQQASRAYQALMTPLSDTQLHGQDVASDVKPDITPLLVAADEGSVPILHIVNDKYGLINHDGKLRLLSLNKIEAACVATQLPQRWQQGLKSQPLLLPIKISIDASQASLIKRIESLLADMGIVLANISEENVQVRQFPALLRHKDVTATFIDILEAFQHIALEVEPTTLHAQQVFAQCISANEYTLVSASKIMQEYLQLCCQNNEAQYKQNLLLNSAPVDLTSEITQLN